MERLLERPRERERLRAALAAAADGVGGAIVLRGPAGIGKTALATELAEEAAARGIAVRRTAGDDLDRELPWATARRLLGRDAARAPADASPDATAAAVRESLFWRVADLCEDGPLLLLWDDAHASDPRSARFLAYLARRAADLPLLVAITVRDGDDEQLPADVRDDLDQLPTLRPAPLSDAAIGELTARRLPNAGAEVARRAAAVSGGNPLLARAVIENAAQGAPAGGPTTIDGTVTARVRRLGPEATAVAQALAVLGDRAPLRRIAALAEVDPERTAAAIDRLDRYDVVEAGTEPAFRHPLVRDALLRTIGPATLAGRHRRAATVLREDGADAEAIAAHLLQATGVGDARAVTDLCTAAERARAAGDAHAAAQLLQRALDEPPEPARRADLLGRLARTQAAAGDPLAGASFAAAVAASERSDDRVALHYDAAMASWQAADYPGAVDGFDRALAELPATATAERRRIRAARLGARFLDPRRDEALEIEELLGRGEAQTPEDRGALAIAALAQVLFLDGDAERCAALAERAWANGQLLRDRGPSDPAWNFVTGAFTGSGHGDRTLAVAGAVLAEAGRLGDPISAANASYVRSAGHLVRGSLADALADAEQALAGREHGWHQYVGASAAVAVRVRIERGQLSEAQALLDEIAGDGLPPSLAYSSFHEARARTLLAAGDPEAAWAAVEDARRASEGFSTLLLNEWRTTGAHVRLALGDRAGAIALAAEEEASARRWGARRLLALALLAAGAAEQGAVAVARLREAVEVADGADDRVLRAATRVELGVALRREGQRDQAATVLADALDRAARCGAQRLAERVRDELRLLGRRPRRDALRGVDALTPSELRVVRLAADGLTNRQIAQRLFVTVKTVEKHLGGAYPKLGVRGRAELTAALADVSETG
ncbi:helix-turn-helix transcriptional regulator [Patulibacter defluvii]|uniref:helix-turn-helix transcriptional regulator n=1 Tax=Patulibacter defluvii TaxID=3095358 RepID=UPI002A759F35|nr:AAA family ATPase [Patulibacter sp. DM4]